MTDWESRFTTMTVTADGPVRIVTMNRPDFRNAADAVMHRELGEIWDALAVDPVCRVVVLTGAGKAFSAGGDLPRMVETQENQDIQEEVFNVPLKLPSGHVVRLRGKFDSVDYVASPTAEAGIWLQENKTKGDIEEEDIARQLTMDLQTMMYLTALYQYASNHPLRDAARRAGAGDAVPLVGVRYNVVRRPLSGGKGSIVRHKPTKKNPRGESLDEYYERVASYIREEPGRYFMRWQAIVNRGEVVRFRQQVLDPLLTQLCTWYEVVTQSHRSRTDPFVEGKGVHWRHPYGVRNPLDEGYAGDVDSYLENGSRVGLVRAETLFPELQPPPTGGAV